MLAKASSRFSKSAGRHGAIDKSGTFWLSQINGRTPLENGL